MFLATLWATWIPGCADVVEASKRPRNVLIIALDTLRADHLGCYGYERPTSPHLDAFARDGFVFENAQSAAPWTTPSLISLMTSLYPDVHQVRDWPSPGRLSPHVTTLAAILKKHGFDTAAFTEGVYAKAQFGLDQGFDYFPPKPGAAATDPSGFESESRIAPNVDRTLEWIRARGARRFFAFFHTYEVHSPYRAPAELVGPFRPGYDEAGEHERIASILTEWNRSGTITREEGELLASRALLMSNRSSWRMLPHVDKPLELRKKLDEYGLATKDLSRRPEVQALARDLYDAGIVSADREIDRLLVGLRELGLEDDTLVVIVSDHGEGLGEHGQMEHGNVLQEEVLHVVLMMRVPGHALAPEPGQGPKRVANLVELVDVAPTVLDVLGLDPRRFAFQGRSLVPAMRPGRSELVERPTFSHARSYEWKREFLYSIRTGAWRLNLDLSTQAVSLYDLAHDPREEVDVAAREPDVVARLRALLLAQHERDLALRKTLASDALRSDLDPETLEELQHLGYAGDSGD